MTFAQNRQLQTGLAGSIVVHAVLLLLLVLGFSLNGGGWRPHLRPKPKPVEKEVVLLFPAQILPVPPPAKTPPKQFVRTSQNEAAPKAAARAAFESDRNTIAASEKAASPDATLAMPTMSGREDRMTNELIDRNYKDGELQKNDSAPKALPVPQMLAGEPPDPLLKPDPSPPPPAPSFAPAPPPAQVAKAETGESALSKMIADMDREAVRMEVNRLPLEIRKPGDPPPGKPAATPPPAPKAPVPDPIARKPKPASEGFSPHTRTSAIKGTITNRGENAVDAERTAKGVYESAVNGAVEKKWHTYRRITGDAVTFGSLKVQFFVTPQGEVEDLRIVSDPRDADARMADFTLRAIQDADIPPIPADVLPLLDDERMKVEYDVIIYR